MTNPMNFIAAASLLILSAANHDPVSAFQSPPAAAASSSSSCLIRRRRPEHVVVGSPSRPTTTPSVPLLASSPYDYDDDDDDDTEGYEIRDGGGGGRNSNNNGNNNNGNRPPLRPETTFGAENVPADFRPSNEYLNLVRQPTFGWASQECGDAGLAIRLAFVYAGFFFLVCYPISGATWISEGYLLQKITSSNVGALSVVFVLILRLYSGWGYIGSRLQSKVIEYEESGWYDGDFEQKSDVEKARDLFLYRSDVRPVEERLRKFALCVGAAWLVSCAALNVATGINPIFNQYDPRMLEKLSYDDKVAEIVQRQSNGRPTYCENRYYRAIANGGQGCN